MSRPNVDSKPGEPNSAAMSFWDFAADAIEVGLDGLQSRGFDRASSMKLA